MVAIAASVTKLAVARLMASSYVTRSALSS
jgi:hypothetical protein